MPRIARLVVPAYRTTLRKEVIDAKSTLRGAQSRPGGTLQEGKRVVLVQCGSSFGRKGR